MICRKLYLQRMDLTQKTWMLCEIEERNLSEGCVGRTPAYDFKISPRDAGKALPWRTHLAHSSLKGLGIRYRLLRTRDWKFRLRAGQAKLNFEFSGFVPIDAGRYDFRRTISYLLK
jgi:hypothetical protein